MPKKQSFEAREPAGAELTQQEQRATASRPRAILSEREGEETMTCAA